MTPEWLVAAVGGFQLLLGLMLGLLYNYLRVGSLRYRLARAWDEGWLARDARISHTFNPYDGGAK